MAYTNLEYLHNITNGDKAIIRDMIEMFFTQIPIFIKNLNNYYVQGEYIALGKEAHKAKSSLQIMGMKDLEFDMKKLQQKTIEGIETESYSGYIRKFEIQCSIAIEELKAELAAM